MSEQLPTETVRYTIEGFIDVADPSDHAMFMVKPYLNMYHDSSIGGLVEDFAIDMSMGHGWEDDDSLDRRLIQNAFYKVRKKNTRNRLYFKRVVEVYPYDDEAEGEIYHVLEKDGVQYD